LKCTSTYHVVKVCLASCSAYGHLTVRSLLDTIEHYLKEFDFPDPYLTQKREENQAALALLQATLNDLDQLPFKERQETLVRHVLAGNMFDWGAKEVAQLLEDKTVEFGFSQALAALPSKYRQYFLVLP